MMEANTKASSSPDLRVVHLSETTEETFLQKVRQTSYLPQLTRASVKAMLQSSWSRVRSTMESTSGCDTTSQTCSRTLFARTRQ